MRADGVLLSGFGGPDCPDAVGPFMRNLTGREPESDVVERVRARYERIGGCSPLRETAVTLGGLVEAILADAGTPVPVAVGMRYWHPTIEEAVTSLASSGAQCIAHVSLSPLESAVTHARYREAIDAAARASDVRVCETASLSALPAYRRAHAEALQAALDVLSGARVMVVFTAHSLPVTASGMDETYVSQFRSLCDDVASMVGLGAGAEMVFADGVAWGNLAAKVPWVACYQSRGSRGDKWLGPQIDDVLSAAAGLGMSAVVVAPAGFALDHMETLYDLDVEARATAEGLGLRFVRASVPNADPGLARAIAQVVSEMECGQG